VVFEGVNLRVQPCFATDVRELENPTLGNRENTQGKRCMLTSCDCSSLVIDAICKQALEENAAVACLYLDFATGEEQSAAVILGSVLKQIIGGLEEVPERIIKAFRDRERVIGGQSLALTEIVEFLQDISSPRSTFICIDALDECPSGDRVKLLDSLNLILQKSSGARLFLTGRPTSWLRLKSILRGGQRLDPLSPPRIISSHSFERN